MLLFLCNITGIRPTESLCNLPIDIFCAAWYNGNSGLGADEMGARGPTIIAHLGLVVK